MAFFRCYSEQWRFYSVLFREMAEYFFRSYSGSWRFRFAAKQRPQYSDNHRQLIVKKIPTVILSKNQKKTCFFLLNNEGKPFFTGKVCDLLKAPSTQATKSHVGRATSYAPAGP